VQVGQTATFSVVASGTAPLSYQWQKNNVDIGGATGSSSTTPAVVAGDNGATSGVLSETTTVPRRAMPRH
jgi:hypothetical protein